MKKEYKFNKEWLDLLLEHKNNENVTFNLSDNDTRILLTYIEVLQQENERLKDKIDKAVNYIKNIDKFEERLNDDTRIYMIQDVDVEEIERILKEKITIRK